QETGCDAQRESSPPDQPTVDVVALHSGQNFVATSVKIGEQSVQFPSCDAWIVMRQVRNKQCERGVPSAKPGVAVIPSECPAPAAEADFRAIASLAER